MIVTLTEDDLTEAVKDWVAKKLERGVDDSAIAFHFTGGDSELEWDAIEATVDFDSIPEKTIITKPKTKSK